MKKNLEFLSQKAGVTLQKRKDASPVFLSREVLKPGDQFAIRRMDGLDPAIMVNTNITMSVCG